MESRIKRGNLLRGRGEGKTYTKRLGKHEHRLVAEEKLGRPLRKGEVVHHIDGDYKNNDPNTSCRSSITARESLRRLRNSRRNRAR